MKVCWAANNDHVTDPLPFVSCHVQTIQRLYELCETHKISFGNKKM